MPREDAVELIASQPDRQKQRASDEAAARMSAQRQLRRLNQFYQQK